MSDGMNKVILLGNLGADPEIRYTASGTAVMHFRMATNESFIDRNRELTERTEWHSVVMFGPRADGLARVLAKGSCVLVDGTLRTTSYEKDGQKRYRTEVHARDICFTNGGSRSSDTSVPSRETEESFVPAELPASPEDPPSVEQPPAAAAPARTHRKRANGSTRSAHSAAAVEHYPF